MIKMLNNALEAQREEPDKLAKKTEGESDGLSFSEDNSEDSD